MTQSNGQFDFSKGFTRDNDLFRRHDFYKSLLKIIKNSPEEGIVIALDDRWGQGKTSFVQMMHGEIKNKNQSREGDGSDEFLEKDLNSIYFDAYENDHHSDPFIPICAEFYSLFSDPESKLEKFGSNFLKYAARVGVAAISGGAKAVISASTAGLINGNVVVDGAIEGVKGTSLDFTDSIAKHVEKKITSAKKEKEDIDDFKKTLSGIHTNNNQKTIFIIDELDRAKPDFSLDLLEKIKHLFSVKNVIFILVMNRNQFEKCIEKRYGGIDSKTYLNKFINYYVSLPKTLISDGDIHRSSAKPTIYNYIRTMPEAARLFQHGDSIHVGLSYLIEINDCSLREAERCIALMSLFSNTKGTIDYSTFFATSIVIMTFLKVYDSRLYDDFMAKKLSSEEMIVKLNLNREFDNGSSYQRVRNIIARLIKFHYFTNDYIRDNLQELNNDYPDLFVYGSQPINPFMEFKSGFENFSLD